MIAGSQAWSRLGAEGGRLPGVIVTAIGAEAGVVGTAGGSRYPGVMCDLLWVGSCIPPMRHGFGGAGFVGGVVAASPETGGSMERFFWNFWGAERGFPFFAELLVGLWSPL